MSGVSPEWVEAVCAARFPTWDDMDTMTKKGARRQAGFWLETSEPLIRADEAWQHHLCDCNVECLAKRSVINGALADLRAKVEGMVDDPLDSNEVANAVLALIDEAQR